MCRYSNLSAAKSNSSARQAIFSLRISWHGHSSCEVSVVTRYLSAIVFYATASVNFTCKLYRESFKRLLILNYIVL